MADATRKQDELEAKSADYAAMQENWLKVNDILIGEDAIMKAGVKYLPLYPDETTPEYNFRLQYAKFTNVFRDITEALASKPFEQEIAFGDGVDNQSVKPTPELEAFADDVDGSGNNITIFAMDTFFNGIAFSMDWIFVDHPPKTTAATLTVADEKALGLRPYWSRVSCVNVYDVQSKVVNGKEVLTYIRIFEPAANGNPNQFREMFCDPVAKFATFQLWVWSETAKDYVIGPGGEITIGMIPMVPFVTGRRNGKSWRTYPPMKDAANLQITLYRAESNLSVTKTFAAFPMLVGQGVKPERTDNANPNSPVKRVVIGPGVTLYAPHTGQGVGTDWHWIAPDAAIMTFLAADVDKTTQQLRELGRQPLTVTSGNLTTITTAVAAGKAKSAVKSWVTGLSDALTNAMYITALWIGQAEGPSVHVFDEFDEFLDAGKDIDALISMADKNKLSDETLWEEMQRRRVLSSEFDPEVEKERLLAQTPNLDEAPTIDPLNPNNPPLPPQ